MLPIDIHSLIRQFDNHEVQALVLMGSYARGTAGPFSDIDLVRFVDDQSAHLPASGSHLVEGTLVVVSTVSPTQVEPWFSQPEIAVETIVGVRQARVVLDRNRYFAAIQQRAHAFVWDESLQAKANTWASQHMVGWIEEVHKGLVGLRRGDVGRLLNARHGCSWGLSRVVQVQRGVLVSGDNEFYDEVAEDIGQDTDWVRLRRIAFGMEGDEDRPVPLRDQVVAGLRLYVRTAEMLAAIVRPEEAPLITHTVALIRATLEGER